MHPDAERRFALLVGQPQQVSHSAHRRALNEERKHGNQKDNVEQQHGIVVLHAAQQRIGGEDDRHGTAQTDPRDVEAGFGREAPEGQQAEKDRNGTGHEHHEGTDQTPQNQHVGPEQFARIYQQAQREEHDDLQQLGETVEKVSHGMLVRQPVVAHYKPREVDRQVAVAVEQGREGERRESEGQQQHRIECVVRDIDPVDGPNGQPPDQIAGHDADGHLHQKHEQSHTQTGGAVTVGHHTDKQHGEHIGYGVVRTALQLQQRPQVLTQPLTLGAKDGEDRRRVGRSHRRGQQQRHREGDATVDPGSDQIDETGQHEGRQHDPHRGEHHTGADNGADLGELSLHTAREEDDTEGDHTHELGDLERVERDDIQSAEEHAHAQEKQQRGGSEPISHLTGHDGDEEQHGPDQHEIFATYLNHRRISVYSYKNDNRRIRIPLPKKSRRPCGRVST